MVHAAGFVSLLTLTAAVTSLSTVRGDQPPGIDYVGAGYDLVFGNPDGSEAASSVTDPGFRTHLIKFTWNDDLDTCSGLSYNWTCPKELTIMPQTSCMQQSSSSMISSTKSFQQVLQKDAKVTASVKGSFGGFSASASFSGSNAMSTMKNKIQQEKVTTFQSKAVCVEYSASLKMGIDSNVLETLAHFNSAVGELPLVYNSCFQLDSIGGQCPTRVDNGFGDVPPIKKTLRRRLQTDINNDDDDDDSDDDTVNDCACDASVIKYFRFIQMFGTHFTTKVEMGGKIIHRVEIKQSDVSLLQSKKVDIAYGASMKASYKSALGGASASVSASASATKSDADKSFEAVKSVAKKELNINVGGSPSEDWREWAKSTMDTPMPIRYTLTSLVDLIAKVDPRKAPLFEQAVADYISAYGRTLSFDTATNANVMFIEVQYSLLVGTMTSATFRAMIGKTGDMLPAVITINKPTGSFRVAVPKQYQMGFDVFAGNIPVTLEYVSGVFTAPKMMFMMEALQMSRKELHMSNMEALMANKKKKKKAPPAASTPTSIYFNTIQPFAVMSDATLLPLDDQYAGKQLGATSPWSINPMDYQQDATIAKKKKAKEDGESGSEDVRVLAGYYGNLHEHQSSNDSDEVSNAVRVSVFAYQATLPHLPVPELSDTLEGYLASLKPFLSEVTQMISVSEFAKSKELVEDFGKSGGEGEKLQKVLLQRAEELPNWLEEWWEYAAYLSDRTSNALYINMVSGFGSFLDFDTPVSQARRAAETIRYTCEYLELLKQEKLVPDKMGGRALCMNMFTRLFSSCRIPGSPVDSFERYNASEIRHIMVFCEGRSFVLPVYDDASKLLTIGDLESQLVHILKHSKHLNSLKASSSTTLNHPKNQYDDGQFIGALTSMGRDDWAKARQELIEYDSYNKDSLEMIQSSLFAVCLDSTTPPNPSALAKECAAGSCGNRWYDKSFQYIVFRNGMVGANMEHANVDATILMTMYRWLGERYLNRSGGYETFIESRHHSLDFLPPPELLKWKLPQNLKSTIPAATARFEKQGDTLRLHVIRNKKYGKANLKQVGIFPDIFVQMAIQLAGFKLFGEWMPTYESGHTRMYLHGRTETIRTVTSEVAAWLQAMKENEPKSVIYDKLSAAMAKHKDITMAALTGQGIDRHLLGLQVAALLSGKKVHPLYSDLAYAKSGGGGNFVLSTSNVSGYPWLWGGFVPMVSHGIGVCYGAESDFLSFIISSFDETSSPSPSSQQQKPLRFTAQQFQQALFASFDEIYELVSQQRRQAKM